MARALSLSQSLARSSSIHRISPTISQFRLSLPVSVSDRRFRSTSTAQLVEIDLDSSDGASTEVRGLKKLEDAIHCIIVRRSAPEWLPFRPGFSYWVPPKPRADNILELVGNLTNPLIEETISFTSTRGWPSPSFFIGEGASPDPTPAAVEGQVHMLSGSDADESLESEDEE